MKKEAIAKSVLLAAGMTFVVILVVVILSQRSAISGDGADISRLQGQVAQLQARVSGQHKDLITCADLQMLSITASGSDAYGNGLSLFGTVDPLPQHCINR